MTRVWTDFNKTGGGRLELTLPETLRDLKRQGVDLRDGLRLTFWDHDAADDGSPLHLEADAIVGYDSDRKCWVAWYEMDKVRWVTPPPDVANPS